MALPPRPPPLQWLPAFEAIGRHLSVKKAADERNVTSSALSQQIKSLEAYLGVRLLYRNTRGVKLSDAGSYYLPLVQEILATNRRAYELLKSRCNHSQLRVNMDPLVANELIIPRLRDFNTRHPHIDLRIETSMHNVNFEQDSTHAAIRCTDQVDKELHGEFIHACRANLLISPTAFAVAPIYGLEDLAKHHWITFTPTANEWDLLFEFLQTTRFSGQGLLRFDNIISAIAATEQGLGVMIGLFPLMRRLLNSGRLVTVSEQSAAIPLAHHLVCRKADKDREDIQLFAQWCKTIFAQA